MKQRIGVFTTAIIGFMLLLAETTFASTHEFFKGQTMRIVVGLSAGGGFDTYARTIARHMGKHIPGNPTIVVENMPGAGSLISANHVYRVAKPDGLTMGHFVGGLFMQQLTGRSGIEFDAVKYQFVGAPIPDKAACALTKASGITNMEQWMRAKTPVKLGSTGSGLLVDIPKILKAAIDLPIQLILGFKGTADIRLAAEGGEVDGACWSYDAIKATWSRGLEAGDVVIVVQALAKPHPELPKVPLAINFAKTEVAKQLIQAGIHDSAAIARPFVLPPATPKDRVALLRKAFSATLKDPEFVADAKKSKLDLDPLTGEELEKIVAGLFKLPPATVTQLREVLK